MRFLFCRPLVVAAVSLSVTASASHAHADQIDTLTEKLAVLQNETASIKQTIRRPQEMSNPPLKEAERRLIDGQVAFSVGNYDDASIILYDYVERYPTSPSYDQALYYLAESLFQKKDYVAARRYFAKLALEVGRRSKFYQQGLERLIELSLKVQDSSDVEQWLNALDSIPEHERLASIPYIRGKYAYFKEQYNDALNHFAKVQAGAEYYIQSRYFMGTSYVALNELGRASQEYERLIRQDAKTIDEKRVIELSHMALGRLYYERDQPSKAIDQYLEIRRRSDLFDEALYEVAWVYVKNRQFSKALRALELLSLADPASSRMPEVRILEGNLRIRKAQDLITANTGGNSTEEYIKAQAVFEKTREAFFEPHAELERILQEREDPRKFIAQITGRVSEVFDTSAALPEVAAAWIREEPEVKRVTAIEADLGDIAADIAEAEQTIERLEHALASPTRVNIFPVLANKRTRTTEILEEIITIRFRLATEGSALLQRYASASEKTKLKELYTKRQQIMKRLQSLPNSGMAYGRRVEQARNNFIALDQRASEVATLLDATRATLVALEKYLSDQSSDGKALPNPKVTSRVIAELRNEIAGMDKELEDIRREVVLAMDEAGMGDNAAIQEKKLRQELQATLSIEHNYTKSIIERMKGDDRRQGERISALMRKADIITQNIEAIHSAIDEVVEVTLKGVRSALADEQSKLAAYKREFSNYEAESQELGAAILETSFRTVKEKFYDVLVRSDIGVVDVSWSQKESADEAAQKLNLDRQRELRTLRDEFRDELEGAAQ